MTKIPTQPTRDLSMSDPYRYQATCVSCGCRVDGESPDKMHNSDGDLICVDCNDAPPYEIPHMQGIKSMLNNLRIIK